VKKRALVVGSKGQDGTLLCDLLEKNGYEVTGAGRGDLDLLDSGMVSSLVAQLTPREIYYLPAYHHSSENLPQSSADLFKHSMNVHFQGVVNFLDAIVRVNPSAKLFYASSSHVFGTSESGMHNEKSVWDPQSEYAITKVAGMQACAFYRRVHRTFASVGILFNHESALRKDHFLSKKIVSAAARIAKEGKGVLELGDLDAQVDWGYAPDYVAAMHKILQLDRAAEYVIATGRLHTVRDFAEISFQSVGLDYRNHVIEKKNEALRSNGRRVGDATKLRSNTGWQPSLDFPEMVRELVKLEQTALT
jgi:GDPmannose 4,6-dehydratase